MDIKYFNNNLKRILKERNISQIEFEKTTKVKQKSISDYIQGKKIPRLDTAIQIANFLGVSLDSLVSPEGPSTQPIIPGSVDEALITKNKRQYLQNVKIHLNDFVYIPRVEGRLSIDDGNFIPSENIKDFWVFRKDWLEGICSDIKKLLLINTDDNTMYPTLNKGDICLIDINNDILKDGNIYAVALNTKGKAIMIRRLVYQGLNKTTKGHNILLINDNKELYDSYLADAREIIILGKVISYFHNF